VSNSSSNPESRLKTEQLRGWALDAGFTEAGLVSLPRANEARDAARFEEWVTAGRAATMHYLTRATGNGDLVRARVAVPFPWARSAIVCFANYNSAQPLSTCSSAPGAGWIARYAWSSRKDPSGAQCPSDYHKVLLKRLKALEAHLHEEAGDFESRAYVDTGPVIERALATAAASAGPAKTPASFIPNSAPMAFWPSC